MILYDGQSANEIWLKIAKDFINTEPSTSIDSRCGQMREFLHTSMSLSDPRQRWIYSRFPGINPAFALAEFVWIMSGANESDVINFWNPALPNYAGAGQKYYGAYGFRLRKHLGIDQIKHAYLALKDNPSSRQVVLQIWDGNFDLPKNNGTPRDPDIPCNIISMLKIRDSKLEWMQIMRSNDIFLGLPYNFVQFTMIQELLAGWLNIGLGGYNQLSDSLHIYNKHFNFLSQSLFNNNKFINVDRISCSYEDSELYLSIIYNIMRKLSQSKPHHTFYAKLEKHDLPESWKNILYIIVADAAMRYCDITEANKLVNKCTNKLYKQIWETWRERKWN